MTTVISLSQRQIFQIGTLTLLDYEETTGLTESASRVEDSVGSHLWVAMPTRSGIVIALPVGTPVGVNVSQPDASYRLPARVHSRRLDTLPLLELAPTGPVERHQRRAFVRLPLTIKPISAVLIGPDDAATTLTAVVIDVSAGGVRLRSREAAEPGQLIDLVIELPEPGGRIRSVVEVVRARAVHTERGLSYETSCRFLDLTERDCDRITRFIFAYQAMLVRRDTGLQG